MPLPDMVAGVSRDFASRVAMVARDPGGDRVFTYEEMGARVRAMARGLVKIGVKTGDRCVILGPNSPEWALAYLSITTAGGVCVPIDSLLSANEMRRLIADSRVKAAFVAPRFLDCVLDTGRGFPVPGHVIAMTAEAVSLPDNVMSIKTLESKGTSKVKLPECRLEDLAAIIYTSGTTGSPKGVMLTHKNIVSDVAASYQAVMFDQEMFLSVLPMHHTFECTAGFLLPIYSGSAITFARSLKSKSILEDLRASRATIMFGVPLLFQKMIEGIHRAVSRKSAVQRAAFRSIMAMVKAGERAGRPGLGVRLFRGLREKAGLGHLKFLVSGGAPLMPWIPREFRRLGLTMIQGYGLTEASPVLTINPQDAPLDNSIGKALPGVGVRVMDPDSSGVGELAFKGPMIMKGYYRDKEATAGVLDREGWLRTGDLGYVDESGYIYICGRAKDLIVTPAGKNVYPEEIEARINRSPFILESMVYGKKTRTGGEDVHALLVPDFEVIGEQCGGKKLKDEYIRSLLTKEIKRINQQLTSYKRIKKFVIREEELPKTSTRKIKRHLVKSSL